MVLKAISPGEAKPTKVKMLISGDPGSGKSTFALNWPKPYLIDAEQGCVRKEYQDKLKEVGGAYFGVAQGAGSFQNVIEEVKTLSTEKHDFKTLIIDSFSHLYLQEAAEAEERIGSDFGKDRKEANKPTRQLMRWINKCDLNVLLLAHNKAKWVRKGNEIYQDGNTFEGYSKLEYDLDIFIEIMPGYKNFLIKKSRIKSLPQGQSMPLSFKHFAEIYGKDIIEKEVVQLELATPVQLKLLKEYIEVLNIDQSKIDQWLKKADVDSFEESTRDQIDTLLETFKKMVDKLKEKK